MKFVFLDRDGVINHFPGRERYVVEPHEFQMFPYAAKAIALLNQAGYEINVISNQGCISRKLLTWPELDKMTDQMIAVVEAGGGKFAGIYYCPHQTSDQCKCRKPKTKLLEDAMQGRPHKGHEMYFVGDSEVDVEAGKSFGCETILVLSGGTDAEDLKSFRTQPDHVMKDLWEAAQWIARKKS